MIRTIFQNEKLTVLLEESVQIIEEICVWQAEGMCDQGLRGIFNVITNLLWPLRWGICSHQRDSCMVQLINHDRCVEKVQSGYRWKPFNVKMLIYFWVSSPVAPQKTCKLVWPLGRETSIDQVQDNCSIEVEELKGITIASNKSLSEVEGKKRTLITVNNRSIKRKNCIHLSVLEGNLSVQSLNQSRMDFKSMNYL